MKKWLMAILFGTVLTLGACGGGNDNDNANEGNNGGGNVDADQAEAVFEDNCMQCHGEDLSGGTGPDLRDVGADHSKDDIVDIIHNGKDGMPAQDQVSDEDADTVAEWLSNKK